MKRSIIVLLSILLVALLVGCVANNDKSDATKNPDSSKKTAVPSTTQESTDSTQAPEDNTNALTDSDKLGTLAQKYYELTTGYYPSQYGVEIDNETATIQLYDNITDGDELSHNSTCAWYSINIKTLKGEDVNTGDNIDLNKVSDYIFASDIIKIVNTTDINENDYNNIYPLGDGNEDYYLVSEYELHDISYINVIFNEDDYSYSVGSTIASVDSLTKDSGIKLSANVPEVLPTNGIQFKYGDIIYKFTICYNGRDGGACLVLF